MEGLFPTFRRGNLVESFFRNGAHVVGLVSMSYFKVIGASEYHPSLLHHYTNQPSIEPLFRPFIELTRFSVPTYFVMSKLFISSCQSYCPHELVIWTQQVGIRTLLCL